MRILLSQPPEDEDDLFDAADGDAFDGKGLR
jgi:hypothetical protein